MFSPPESHESQGDKNATTSDVHYHDKVVYAAPAQTKIIPHQTSATGELYALSTKTVHKASQEHLVNGRYDDVLNVKKDTGGVSTW